MIRHVDSPEARAASTQSLLRNERVCERSTLAPHDQPVITKTNPILNGPLLGKKAARRMARGSVGSTRKTLVTSERDSSTNPRKYPEVNPTSTEKIRVIKPIPSPINTEKRAPTTVWTKTSSPKLVVPNQ